MIELLFALLIGMVLGYLLKREQKPPVAEILTNQVEKLESDLAYYKKGFKTMANENMELRRKLGGWNNPDLRTYDGKLE
jgi:uncharacterized membrane-anchored protein YhcB (DUF1043 family)